MLRYLLCVWLAFANYANAGQEYLTVTGTGSTFEQAKQNAFRKAIEFKLGVLVVSDLEVKNKNIDREEIYLYSAGYVTDYKVLSQEKSDVITVLLEVQVSDSKLKNRVLGVGKSSTEFTGEKHSAQVTTYIQEQQQGDRILEKVLNDFPLKAFKVKQSQYNVTIDSQRKPIINVPYELSWNFEFIKSLRETLDAIHDCEPTFFKPCASSVVVMAKDPKDLLIGKRTDHYFNDTNRYDQVHNRFSNNEPRIVIRLYDVNGTYIYGTCYTPKFIWGGGESFYATGGKRTGSVYGNTIEKGTITLYTPLYIIDRTSKIELTTEQKDICRNNT